MEKRLRSSPQSSATNLTLKSSKPSLRSLIHKIKPSSLPLHLPLPPILPHLPPTQTLILNPLALPPPSAPAAPPRPDQNPEEDKNQLLRKLQILACVAELCASHPAKAFPPADLLPGVQLLHDNLIILESDSTLVSTIVNLCELWWKEELPGRESLISQSLPFLLSRSLTLNKRADVHRVYSLREAFTCFDFEDESIEDLKLLLIRCVISPLYWKAAEGRKFLAFPFGRGWGSAAGTIRAVHRVSPAPNCRSGAEKLYICGWYRFH